MKNVQDYRDTFVTGVVTAGWLAATVFLFMYPASINFATWAGLVATIGGIYHFLCVSDDKRVDAGNVSAVLPNFPDEGTVPELRDWSNK